MEIPRDRLRVYGLTLAEVTRLIEESSEDIPAVALETETDEGVLALFLNCASPSAS